MKKNRKLTIEEQTELKRIIADKNKPAAEILKAQTILMLNRKTALEDIRELTNYKRSQIFELRKRFLKEGVESLVDKRKGEPKELLSKQQREEILELVKTKTPKDFGYTAEFWTTGFLGYWIERMYGVKYKSKNSLYLVFKKAKFTYHKPGRVYDKHSDKEIKEWKEKTEARLKKMLSDTETVILAEDEMILTTETTIQKVWLPAGEFPKITSATGGRKRRSIYGFLNIKTGTEHAYKTELQNMYVTAEILKKIRGLYPEKKIALFWDNAGWHLGRAVKEWIARDGNIEVVPFPRYAPEENPQEHVWKSGRSEVTHNRFIEDIDAATDGLIAFFQRTNFNYKLLGFSPNS